MNYDTTRKFSDLAYEEGLITHKDNQTNKEGLQEMIKDGYSPEECFFDWLEGFYVIVGQK